MIHWHITWLMFLRFLRFILCKFKLDNKFIEIVVNKCRNKLKEDFSNAETKLIDKIINYMVKLNVIPREQITMIHKKYYSMINSSTDKRVDELCDYIIIVYNANF